MAQRSRWQDRYGYGEQSAIDTAVASSYGLFMVDHSDLSPGQEQIISSKIGRAAAKTNLTEFEIKNKVTFCSLPLIVSPAQIYPALRFFFQSGSLQDSTTNTIKWFYPYSYSSTGSVCEVWASLFRDTSSGTTRSQRMTGAISHELEISLGRGEYITAISKFLGRDLEINRNTSGDTFTLSTNAPLLLRNCVTKIGNSYEALETFDLKSFNLRIRNNAKARTYNSSYVSRFNLGRVEGQGEIITPWENNSTNYNYTQAYTDFFAGTLTRISIYWADQYLTSGSSMSINLLGRFVKGRIAEDKEISNTMEFVLVEDASFSYENSKITDWVVDGSDASLIDLTFSGSEILTGNVFPGDAIVTDDASIGNSSYWTIERIIDTNTIKLTSNHTAGTGASGNKIRIIRQPINVGIRDGINRGIT